MEWRGEQVAKQIEELARKNLRTAAIYLSGRVKETLSIAAPRKRVMIGNTISYLASQKATAGAPARKLSGRLRQSISWDQKELTARVGTNLDYGKYQEFGYTLKAGRFIPVPTDFQYTAAIAGSKQKARLFGVRWIRLKHDVKVHHPFLEPTLQREASALARIMGTEGHWSGALAG